MSHYTIFKTEVDVYFNDTVRVVNFNVNHDIWKEHLATAYNTTSLIETDLLVHLRWMSSPDTSRVPQSPRGLGQILKSFTRLRGTG